ncbi:enoyl-CoA hydratase domain-containing protein 3, mitochondrial isoform X1 [Parasteatoda tepidariorum]|uniref:enoyl-CoA hydratase domain-containing protein 3, mitochondrial isoform X1 n=1 Tax=Parasteatoda tepidariorum TaxID=114398 RepID=UPI001C724A12|nr:enoyl-CoA hydratase domain-containing protein 3, mitochondrial [Parasteatoda tepidariorum]
MSCLRMHKIGFRYLSRSFSSEANLTTVLEQNGVRRITLNNPKKRNALSFAMLQSLQKNIFENIEDINLRCIVLQSQGPVFSSGHDLKELHQSDQKKREEIFQLCSNLMMGLQNIPVPVVAVVNGLAAAAGCQLIASCDITLASTKSHFSTPGASVGLFCSTPGIAISRNIPLKAASYMLLTGNTINANEALQVGLVSKISDEENLESLVENVLQSILFKSRCVLAMGKKFFYEQLNQSLPSAYRHGNEIMIKNLAHREAEEGINAFFSKKPPKWQHE